MRSWGDEGKGKGKMGAGYEVRVQLRVFGACVGGCMRV